MNGDIGEKLLRDKDNGCTILCLSATTANQTHQNRNPCICVKDRSATPTVVGVRRHPVGIIENAFREDERTGIPTASCKKHFIVMQWEFSTLEMCSRFCKRINRRKGCIVILTITFF